MAENQVVDPKDALKVVNVAAERAPLTRQEHMTAQAAASFVTEWITTAKAKIAELTKERDDLAERAAAFESKLGPVPTVPIEDVDGEHGPILPSLENIATE